MYRILIVEDDRTIAGALAAHLGRWDYQVACVEDFKNVMDQFRSFDPQLVLLDIMLPFYNGFYWCQEIRRTSNVPVIFLSSANDNMNIVGFCDENNGYSYVSGGIYCLTSKAIETLELCIKQNQSRMRNFQRQLIKDGSHLIAYPFDKIVDVDHVDDISKAENFLAEK